MATKKPNFVVAPDGATKILRKPACIKPAPVATRAQQRRVRSQLERATEALRNGRPLPPMGDPWSDLFRDLGK